MLSEKLLELSLVGAEWVLWVIVGLSIISIWMIGDRLVFYARTRERLEELEPNLRAALQQQNYQTARTLLGGDSLVRNVLRAGVEVLDAGHRAAPAVEQAMLSALARERVRYDKRLTPLATIGSNAPFVGLFGTVLGIIGAFSELGKAGAASGAANGAVMTAIGEALVATAAGIVVAIPAVAVYNFAKSHVAGRSKRAEALMRSLLSGLRTPSGEVVRHG